MCLKLERGVVAVAVWGSKAGPASNPRSLTACPLKFAQGERCLCLHPAFPSLNWWFDMVRYIVPWTSTCSFQAWTQGGPKTYPSTYWIASLTFFFWKTMPMELQVYALSEHLCTVKCTWAMEVFSRPARFFGWYGWIQKNRTSKMIYCILYIDNFYWIAKAK